MLIALFIWSLLVLINALIRFYLYPIYFGLKPVDKVNKGYLKWGENFTYQHSVWTFKDGPDLRLQTVIHYRFDIQIRGLFRALTSPLNFNKELKKLINATTDVNTLDPNRKVTLTYTRNKTRKFN